MQKKKSAVVSISTLQINNPVCKITEKTVSRNVFLTTWQLTKTHSFRLFFLAILPKNLA